MMAAGRSQWIALLASAAYTCSAQMRAGPLAR